MRKTSLLASDMDPGESITWYVTNGYVRTLNSASSSNFINQIRHISANQFVQFFLFIVIAIVFKFIEIDGSTMQLYKAFAFVNFLLPNYLFFLCSTGFAFIILLILIP